MHRSIKILTIIILTCLFASLLAACTGSSIGSTQGGPAPDILTSTTILADITRNVAGERFSVGSLLPVGTDPHSYQPTPQDTARISKSKVLIVNGAGYENFLETILNNADGERTLIEASASLRLRSDTKNEQGIDPHVWLDPNNVIVYVENIRDGLTKFDPDGAETYKANANAYIQQLTELDAWINGQIVQITPESRLLVTNHEALGYFADRYDFQIIGTVIESFSSDASPSAQQMAALVDQIKLFGAPAIFLDASDNPALAQQIAAETGVKVITDLHLESLTDGAPAPTYIELMKSNVTTIIKAFQ